MFTLPKTAKSHRTLRLPAPALHALLRHRAQQRQEQSRLGPAWDELDLVFANEVGRPIETQNLLRRSFYPLLEHAGLPRIRFHDLRHTAATTLLAKGLPVNAVSELLGHSNAAITVGVYGHTTADMRDLVVAAMEGLVQDTSDK
jgi:integrase